MTSKTTTLQLPAYTICCVQHLNRDIQSRPVIIGAWVVTTHNCTPCKLQ